MTSNTQNTVRSEQKKITRQKLLDTTIEIIAGEGLAGLTMAKVAEKTGLSRGICNYHFETKEQLMLEAFTALYREHEKAWRKITSDESLNPGARLKMLITTMLSLPIADPKKLAVWMAFWGVTPHRKIYLEICASVDREYEAEMEGLLRQLSDGKDTINGMSLRAIAIALSSMIDGLWINYLISPGCLTRENSIKACLAFLSSFFPENRSFQENTKK